MDTVSPQTRSAIMRKVCSTNTIPELRVRSALHSLGYRFRIHAKDLPGTPDIVLPRFSVALFVHGCFWHKHRNCKNVRIPGTNTDYWLSKLDRNVNRDKINRASLRKLGWKPIVIWECQTKTPMKLFRTISRMMPPWSPAPSRRITHV